MTWDGLIAVGLWSLGFFVGGVGVGVLVESRKRKACIYLPGGKWELRQAGEKGVMGIPEEYEQEIVPLAVTKRAVSEKTSLD